MRTLLILLSATTLMACQADPISLVLTKEGTATLTNGTGVPIYYQGYAVDSPVFSRESWDGGNWQAEPVGWCGTGLSRQTLPAGKKATFAANPPADAARWRLVMTVQRAEGEARMYSNPVDVDGRQE